VYDINVVLGVDLKRRFWEFLEKGNRGKEGDDRYVQYNCISNACYAYTFLSHPLKQLIEGVL
jgi:hypothetical protein